MSRVSRISQKVREGSPRGREARGNVLPQANKRRSLGVGLTLVYPTDDSCAMFVREKQNNVSAKTHFFGRNPQSENEREREKRRGKARDSESRMSYEINFIPEIN